MTLIKSISGIRGTIGGKESDNLTPPDIIKFSSAFAAWAISTNKNNKIVIGRDARVSGQIISNLVANTLMAMGIDVIDLRLTTTPTVEMAVPLENASGGIIITASHNPHQWNALKLVNNKGEFISDEEGKVILRNSETQKITYASIDNLGKLTNKESYHKKHIELILRLPLVNVEAIKKANFHIIVDAVNSSGGVSVPYLLEKLGVKVKKLFCEPNGLFPHNPEPLPEHLLDICNAMKKNDLDLGIVVDPDVDRLAFVDENGKPFGEEYTLITIADYVLKNKKGAVVSNLSSSMGLKDVAKKYDCEYFASAVGEVNVVKKMKETDAVIGGEGNGGVIFPELHYGRDALVGIALFLSHLALSKMTCSEIRSQYSNYYLSKNKITIPKNLDITSIFERLINHYSNHNIITIDGLKIIFENEWVHIRSSNTEPIIRIYAESDTKENAEKLANQIITFIKNMNPIK